jgi:hypothetical protein
MPNSNGTSSGLYYRMESEKKVSVTLTLTQIKQALSLKIVGCPEKEILIEAIIKSMEDANKLDNLVSGLFGSTPVTKFSKGDQVSFKTTQVHDGAFDAQRMINENMIVDGKMKGTIINVNPWASSPYRVSYEYIDKNGDYKKYQYNLSDWGLEIAEEFPENMI